MITKMKNIAVLGRALFAFVFLCFFPLHSSLADSFIILNDSGRAFETRLAMVREAKQEIDTEYFQVEDDRLAAMYFSELERAASGGKTVRLLVDAEFGYITKEEIQSLLKAGVQIKKYHPLNILHLLWINERLHDKMVLVDQAKLLTGGRNLTVAYFGLDKKDQNYLDRDIYVEGAAAVEAQGYFSQVWNSQEVRDVTEKRVEASPSPSTNPAPSTEAEAETLFPSLMGNDRIVTTPMKTGAATQFFSDPVEADSAGLSTSQDIYHTFEEATDSILIESAYLIMTPELQHAFEIAQARAVANGKTLQIRILTNSAIANDMDSASAAYLLDKKKLASMGIELWEYDGPDALHSKSFLIDGRKIIIGTFNLDPRSQNLNTEIAVSFDDVQAASLLKKSMDQDLEKSHLVAENGVLIPEPAYAGKMGFSRKVKIKVLEALSPILKDLF